MKRVTLELGGKSPTLILPDADLEGAVRFALTVGLINTGSACIAGTRILVPASRAAEFKAALKAGMEALKPGDPADPATSIQPMIAADHWQRVQDYIRKGLEDGAELVTGGLGKPAGLEAGNFVKPTVSIANDTEFGLHAYVYGGDRHQARAVANRLEAGRVMINAMVDDPKAPFGGFKLSGFGREFGVAGMQAFTEPRAVFG